MGDLEKLKNERLTTRTISVESFSAEDDRVVIEGRLEDERRVDAYSIWNEPLGPGPVHGMVVRFLVGGVPPRIIDVEVEVTRVPYDECRDAALSVKELMGLNLSYGFSREVRARLGGIKGCVHLTSLVLAMGAAALQGWAAHKRRERLPGEVQAYLTGYIKDSCRVWRADGENYKKALKVKV